MRDLIPVLLVLAACAERGQVHVPAAGLRPASHDTDDTPHIETDVPPDSDTDVLVVDTDTGEGLSWPDPVIVEAPSVVCAPSDVGGFSEWGLQAAVPPVPKEISDRGFLEVQLVAWTILPRGCASPVLGGDAIAAGLAPATWAITSFPTLATCDARLELGWVVIPEDGLPHVYASTTDLSALEACPE